jgi:signal-transduction protein with cAMP-binding, CBS, and nucleotidyltransferase domain
MNLLEHLSLAITCGPDLSLAEVALFMEQENVGSIVVIDDRGVVVGIATDRDLALRGMGRRLAPDTPVSEVMTRDVILLREDADLFDAASQMAAAECRRLPVLGLDGTLKGVVTLDDLMVLFAHQTDSLAQAVAAEMAVH